ADGQIALAGDDCAGDGAAEPALAGPHAAADEGLYLVRPLRAEPHRAADLTGGDLLAAADDDLVRRIEHAGGRLIKRVEKRPDRPLARQRGADRCGAAVAFGGIDAAEQVSRVERRQPAAERRRTG